jgi:D-alanyl-D-alanine carboxypeptidase/D-alanyl-D-alanine-endopeptidase (penicillin-binding protein 4)
VQTLDSRIQAVLSRPQFKHAMFGIEIYSVERHKALYALNSDKLFVPGSVTKLITEGTALELLGGDYRFHTRVYRTGALGADGVLHGDLVLVASGDPNLSNRIKDDSLLFENDDHSYGFVHATKLLPGDPLTVIRAIARQVAAKGVKRIDGRVLVDTSLFPEGTREGGTGVVLSPIALNDNVIDVLVTAGNAIGAAATLTASPATKYAGFRSELTTSAADKDPEFDFFPTKNADGTYTVVARGTVPLGTKDRPFPWAVPQPSAFAQRVLSEELQQAGVAVANVSAATPDWKALSAAYKPETLLAEHVSPPLREDTKVTLKVSQNLHASLKPYLIGAILCNAHDDALQAGFRQEREFLTKAGLDVSAAAQSDGAGAGALFSPEFVVRFLDYMSKQKDAAAYYAALPILGRDGTLWDSMRDSPVAGKLHAKTGTFVTGDLLNEQYIVNGKGLAGYLETKSGKRLIVAIFANHVGVGDKLENVLKLGDVLAEVAAAAYDLE